MIQPEPEPELGSESESSNFNFSPAKHSGLPAKAPSKRTLDNDDVKEILRKNSNVTVSPANSPTSLRQSYESPKQH